MGQMAVRQRDSFLLSHLLEVLPFASRWGAADSTGFVGHFSMDSETMENHHFWWENQGFRLGHVLFSYVRNYQRVDFGVELDSITTYQNLSNWFKLIQTHWELRIVRRDGEKTALLPWGNRCLRHAVRRAQTRILKMKEALQLRNVRWGYGMILPKSCQNHGGKFGWMAVHGINSSVSLIVLL